MNVLRTPAGRTALLLLIALGVVIEGIVVIRTGPSYAFPRAVLTTISGWAIAGSGLLAWRLAPASHAGKWLVLAGAAFIVEGVAGPLTWLPVGFLGGAILTMPDGRPHTRAGGVIIAAFILVALAIPADRPLLLAVAFAAAMLLRRALERPEHRQGPADLAGLVIILVLAWGAAAGPFGPVPGFATITLYAAASAATAMIIAAMVIQASPTVARVADEVLRVERTVPLSIGRELRRATGQASLRVVFPALGGEGYIDASGEPVELPRPGTGRMATPIRSSGGRIEAMVLHDRGPGPVITLDPGIARAGALSAANARLQAELLGQVAEVRASRRRLLDAEHAERRRLRERLAAALLPALADIESGLASMEAPDATAITHGLHELRQTLDAVTDGLHPAIAGERGLDGAIRRAVARCPVATTVVTTGLDQPLDPDLAATAWNVCSEALTNVAKHARASHAAVEATLRDGRLVLRVEDDGIGGADLEAGSGLRGMRDRLETMGGALRLEPVAGGGTRVLADLPVGTP